MNVNDVLFSKKFRPSSLDDIILLPRIREVIKDGLRTNLILYGPFGCGKSSLSKILIKNHPNLYLNSSFYTSIDVLRDEVDKFCSKMSMFDSNDNLKIVFLDEIDRVSKNYQDALKGFIEEYEDTVRFIATTNHINRIDGGVRSRFTVLDYNPINSEEEKYLKTEYCKKIAQISKLESIKVGKDDIINIVNKNFPDLRQMTTLLQTIKTSGIVQIDAGGENQKLKTELYRLIIDKSDNEKIYDFIYHNFGDSKVDELIKLLGRPFIEFAIKEDRSLISKMNKYSKLSTEYAHMFKDCIDPFVLGYSLVCEMRD